MVAVVIPKIGLLLVLLLGLVLALLFASLLQRADSRNKIDVQEIVESRDAERAESDALEDDGDLPSERPNHPR